jgi:hypothetical protein
MITFQSRLEEYKAAIRSKYEVEKTKEYSSFLLNPSRALLRRLCVERFKENATSDDLKTFALFFGFEFENKKKLQEATDKFRPIETFLKGDTDPSDIEAINMAAILVDFNPRPFAKFKTLNHEIEEVKTEVLKIKEEESTPLQIGNSKKKLALSLLLILSIFLLGYTSKKMFFSADCMQWNGTYYEKVNCDVEQNGIGSFAKVTPYNKYMFELKKIEVCDTTTFFIGDVPVVWYCTTNGEKEYFTSHGFHPVTGKALKPMTKYIYDKHVKPCD